MAIGIGYSFASYEESKFVAYHTAGRNYFIQLYWKFIQHHIISFNMKLFFKISSNEDSASQFLNSL
jgi:hypothetical protein